MAGNNDDELERRAVEELLKEANRGRVRAETMGPAGWMKCPLGSTNKRFLLNTLRPSAAEHRSGSRSDTTSGAEDSREDRDRQSYHHTEDREHSKHRRGHPHSHSQSSRSHDSSVSQLACTVHTPRHSSKSNRTRSRSPIRERPATKRSPNRTRK
ncbi:hypothetical protein QTP70_024223 [Hemibagrus guttatus]|uniref:Uncharacterized protein n=1 Tax=Hemibagrus guttatus TaxID=175788 RepID=A0AAE0Q7Z2_9TELE|nr:hypothetical protein QTP70_024223 [Hemibagrus guttatus]KAK3541489.1 hypothetical protein QTP86_027248 [Hemibagrus guttatus]